MRWQAAGDQLELELEAGTTLKFERPRTSKLIAWPGRLRTINEARGGLISAYETLVAGTAASYEGAFMKLVDLREELKVAVAALREHCGALSIHAEKVEITKSLFDGLKLEELVSTCSEFVAEVLDPRLKTAINGAPSVVPTLEEVKG